MDFPGSLARSVTPESEENRSQNGAVDAPNEPNLRRGAPLPPLSHLSQIPAIASSIHGKNAFFTEEDLPGCLQDLNAAGWSNGSELKATFKIPGKRSADTTVEPSSVPPMPHSGCQDTQ